LIHRIDTGRHTVVCISKVFLQRMDKVIVQ
jgi:hypothetical protein